MTPTLVQEFTMAFASITAMNYLASVKIIFTIRKLLTLMLFASMKDLCALSSVTKSKMVKNFVD